jgi:site-specific DNA recombinase
MKTVALYARVSSEHQAQQATVESQLAELKQRATEDGHTVLPTEIYVDDGFSGTTLVRPALERLRDRIHEGAIDVLYVHSPDRLARRYAYQVVLLDEFRKAQTSVAFLHGPRGQTAEDELLVQVQGVIAEYERAKILERCRRGKLHRARQGFVSAFGGAPYGFAYIKKSSEAPASYKILLHEAKVVRKIFHDLVREQKSLGTIAKELNEQKVPTVRGGQWHKATVGAILRNPAYMGKAAFGKSQACEPGPSPRPIRGRAPVPRRAKSSSRDTSRDDWTFVDVPAIVSSEVFDAAREQLERNKRLSKRNTRGRYLLQGLTVCARCNYAFYAKTGAAVSPQGGRYSYYRCSGTDSYRLVAGRVCQNPLVRVDQLDGFVWDSVCALLQNPARVMDEWTRRGKKDGVADELRANHAEALRAVATHERTLKRILDAYEIGAIELKDLKTRTEAIRARIARSQADVEQANQKLRETIQLRAVVTRLEDFAARVRKGLDEVSWEDRRHIVRTLISRVVIDEDGATIVYRLPSTDPTPPHSRSGSRGNGASQTCQLRRRGHGANGSLRGSPVGVAAGAARGRKRKGERRYGMRAGGPAAVGAGARGIGTRSWSEPQWGPRAGERMGASSMAGALGRWIETSSRIASSKSSEPMAAS